VLSAERALAKKWLARIQDRARGTRNAMKTLGESRAVLANHLKTMKIGTDLMTDTYSGAVASFPAARFDDPPCLVRLAELYSASKERRLIDERDIEACSNELMEARNNMKVALDLALHQSKNLQRALILATGAARLARNKVARDDHEILIATGCNDGPAEGAAYLFTREKSDRPLVRKCVPFEFLCVPTKTINTVFGIHTCLTLDPDSLFRCRLGTTKSRSMQGKGSRSARNRGRIETFSNPPRPW
jgi:hypothetical protein